MRGGPRRGAGRPKGAKGKNAKGRVVITKSVSMPAEAWREMDLQRGEIARGKFIQSKL
jgi:hypothetical protein